jgi:hypothetical protein
MHNSYMADIYQKRRVVVFLVSFVIFAFVIVINTPNQSEPTLPAKTETLKVTSSPAIDALNKLAIKGRAPKTNYTREQFGAQWTVTGGCDTRNIILNRDLTNVVVDEKCDVISGALNDPYTGKIIQFTRGSDTSGAVQIDHVVALSDAWQKGAQQFTSEKRIALANDPLELLAVDGPTNLQKSDGDAATWLPPNKSFRCQYVARQIAVKQKYNLWVTQAEHDTMVTILNKCLGQLLPSP